MPHEYDTSLEEISGGLMAALRGARLLPDLAAVWRAVGERQRSLREEDADRADSPAPAMDDPMQLIVRANSLMLNAQARLGLDWQRLASRRLPAIRRALDTYRRHPDPLPEDRDALLDEVALLLTETAELAGDHGRAIQQDIEAFQRRVFDREPAFETDPDVENLAKPTWGGKVVKDKKDDASASGGAGNSVRGVVRDLGLAPTMDQLKGAIRSWLDRTDPHIRGMLKHQFEGDAKYFRPLTVFSCHRATSEEPVPPSLIVSAQAVEMFHNSTLIVDDLVDNSKSRRGKKTLHEIYDPLMAYMVAGYIIADAIDLIARQLIDEGRDMGRVPRRRAARVHRAPGPDDQLFARSRFRALYVRRRARMPGADEPELDSVGPVRFDIRLLSELLKRLAVAECVQWRHRAKPFGLADWYWLAREDTGSMFEICACLGARSQRLRRFGRLLGMLYHGCDDVADVSAAKALGSGEDENADLKDRILTLPAALACARDSEIRELFGDIKRRTKRDKNKLLGAYKRSLPTAEEELDKIAKLAKQEAEANSARPAPLIRLIEYTRKLSRA